MPILQVVVTKTYQPDGKLLALLWEVLWPALKSSEREQLLMLPKPCLNHLENRLSNAKRRPRLVEGCSRLIEFDRELLFKGLRLHPHELCRAAEALGPLPEELWVRIYSKLLTEHIWFTDGLLAKNDVSDELWLEIESLARRNELPQVFLDSFEDNKASYRETLVDFLPSLKRFLVRAKLERVRHAAYQALRDSSTLLS